MKARHMYKVKYKCLLLKLNYCHSNDTSGRKSNYTTKKFMCRENKYFQWTVGGKGLEKNKRIKVSSDVKTVKNGKKSDWKIFYITCMKFRLTKCFQP